MTDDTFARIAYRAYGDATGGLNYQGLPMPAWDNLGDTIQAAWIAAANRVAKVVKNPMTGAADASRAAYGDAWTELTGYVSEAVADGGQIDPIQMRDYMRELKRRALAPMRQWMTDTTSGPAAAPGSAGGE